MKVIGLMSGTSVDGIDAALVEIGGHGYDLAVELVVGQTVPYPVGLREQILAVCGGEALSMAQMAELDDAIATTFAQAAQALLPQGAIGPSVNLIGSHGQTLYHRPPQQSDATSDSMVGLGYSVQLGRGALIAALTGVPTVSNFRVADIAAGGQGAPLVSPIDACLMSHPHHSRCIQNLGGIGNVTYLPAWDKSQGGPLPDEICGWDTGPANSLLDWAVSEFSGGQLTYDADGAWAAQGNVCQALLNQWLSDPFFAQPPPKSTGRERFGAQYAAHCVQAAQALDLSPADTLATLSELTAASVELSYRQWLKAMPKEVLLCGGGSRNRDLQRRLQARLSDTQVTTTDAMGLDGDYKEAMAFAVLAFWRWHQIPGNLPRVTGARQGCLLGELAMPFGQPVT
jgi:anhydro-N-acetylmuramic acid kinase